MKQLIILIVLFLYVISHISAQVTSDLLCTKEYCEEEIVQNSCKSLPKECDRSSDGNGGIMLLEPSICNCCDYCLKYLNEGDDCVFEGRGQPLPDSICGPGLGCNSTGTCVPLNTTCLKDQQTYDRLQASGLVGITETTPLCDSRGFYHPVHCIGGSICYCVNLDGNRIFGEKIYSSPDVPETMDCECSRAAWKAEQLAAEWGVQQVPIHCLEDGSYDLLQCIDDMCQCLDSTTKISDSDVQPVLEINLMKDHPACFDPKKHTTGKYKRACEEKLVTVLEEMEMLKDEGITPIGLRIPRCQYDGRYDRLMITDEEKSCVDPNGELLKNYVILHNESLSKGMDCNCARTSWLLESEGQTELPVCCDNGNFREMQCRRGKCYCVDCNGNQLVHEVDEDKKASLSCSDRPDACAKCLFKKPEPKIYNFLPEWDPLKYDKDYEE